MIIKQSRTKRNKFRKGILPFFSTTLILGLLLSVVFIKMSRQKYIQEKMNFLISNTSKALSSFDREIELEEFELQFGSKKIVQPQRKLSKGQLFSKSLGNIQVDIHRDESGKIILAERGPKGIRIELNEVKDDNIKTLSLNWVLRKIQNFQGFDRFVLLSLNSHNVGIFSATEIVDWRKVEIEKNHPAFMQRVVLADMFGMEDNYRESKNIAILKTSGDWVLNSFEADGMSSFEVFPNPRIFLPSKFEVEYLKVYEKFFLRYKEIQAQILLKLDRLSKAVCIFKSISSCEPVGLGQKIVSRVHHFHRRYFESTSDVWAYADSLEGPDLRLTVANRKLFSLIILGITQDLNKSDFGDSQVRMSGKSQGKNVDYRKLTLRLSSTYSKELPLYLAVKRPIDRDIRYFEILPYGFEDELRGKLSQLQGAEKGNPGFVLKHDREWVVSRGHYKLRRDLVIPKGIKLKFEKGVHLDLENSAMILSFGPIVFEGTESDPIVIFSSDSSGQGVSVLEAGSRSTLNYVTFSNLRNPKRGNWELTGAVNFYRSSIFIDSCKFLKNNSEDGLNIISTNFEINNSHFVETLSDALDVDFGKGVVRNSTFKKIGNDAVDFSTSIIELKGLSASSVGDKGVSAGEGSVVVAEDVEIQRAKFGLVSKDRSKLNVLRSTVRDSDVGISAYTKKTEFGPARASLTDVRLLGVRIEHLAEVGSTIEVEGKSIVGTEKKLADKIYGTK